MKQTRSFSPQQTRILLGGIIVFGVGSLSLGVYGIQQQIFRPFSFNDPANLKLVQAVVPQSEQEKLAGLKTKDTDGDGLSDYDEVYIYNTSPYLLDTDSDGIGDGQEVKKGTDPNCPPDQDCRGVRLVTPDTKISDLFPQFSDSTITLKEKTVKDFRAVLLQQGFDKDKLAAIDDDTLVLLLGEVLKAQDEINGTPTTTASTLLTPADIDKARQLLVELGAPQNEVNSLSNEEVEKILKTLQ